MLIETLDRRTLCEVDARAITELLVKIWPRRPYDERLQMLMSECRDYHGPEAQFPRACVIREGKDIIAHAAGGPRTIVTSAGELTVLALARVCTAPQARGQGFGVAVVQTILSAVDSGTFSHALFQTSYKVQSFYEKLGACLVENRIVNSTDGGSGKSPFWEEIAMRYPAFESWPSGDIDLRGPGY